MTMNRAWIDPQPVTVPEALQVLVGGDPLVAEVLVRRGIDTVAGARAFLDPFAYQPASAWTMPGMDEAVATLEQALKDGSRLCVWGDFDVDGQTSTAILVTALRALGGSVSYYVPSRAESHGLNVRGLGQVMDDGAQLVVTCDTGVTAHEAIAYCRSRGVPVLVTDHHDLPEELPPAVAVVNPKRLPDGHPLHELTGAGCAFKVVEALGERLGRPDLAEPLLDLVAIGLVGDVASLVDDVRYLVQRGLMALRQTRRKGLLALYEVARLNPAGITAQHIGYSIGPRLNALGRLAHAKEGVELLITDDTIRAQTIASTLEALNNDRKLLVKQVHEAAERQLAQRPALLEDPALVLAHEGWKESVIGIVAGRLADSYGKPAILISVGQDGRARGSARSYGSYDIHEAIGTQAERLIRYGGHPMAAGFAIDADQIDAFATGVKLALSGQAVAVERPSLALDGYAELGRLTLELARDLQRLGPFGEENPAVCLGVREVAVQALGVFGRGREHRRALIRKDDLAREVLMWHGADMPLPENTADVAVHLAISDFQGETRLQLEWVDWRPVIGQAATVHEKAGTGEIEVIDLRQVADPAAALAEVREKASTLQVWAEGSQRVDGGADRDGLQRSEALCVWTSPCGPAELRRAMARVKPARAYVVALAVPEDGAKAFLARLLGLIKHAMGTREGRLAWGRLAALMAHRESTVRAGVEWLAATGRVDFEDMGRDVVFWRGGRAGVDAGAAEAGLLALLEETARFRALVRRAPLEQLERMLA